MSKRLKEIEEFIKKEFENGIQAFDTENIVGDETCTIYKRNGVQIDWCMHYDYIEIFGLSGKEFEELEKKGVIN